MRCGWRLGYSIFDSCDASILWLQFAPKMFAPKMFAPKMFAPKMFAPKHLLPCAGC